MRFCLHRVRVHFTLCVNLLLGHCGSSSREFVDFDMQRFVTLKQCCGVSAARQRIHQLKADIDRLGKSVNSSAGMLLEKTEAELQTLLNRKAQVEGDRVRTHKRE